MPLENLISDLRNEVKELKDAVAEKKSDGTRGVNPPPPFNDEAEPPVHLSDDVSNEANNIEKPPVKLAGMNLTIRNLIFLLKTPYNFL